MASRSDWFRDVFLNNWWLKVLALMLAGVSFYAVRHVTSFKSTYEIPLTVEVSGVAVLEKQPDTIRVTFRGSPEDLAKLNQKDLKVLLRPEVKDPTGSQNEEIVAGNIVGASGVVVDRIDPETVRLSFDRQIQERCSVAKPEVNGAPSRGRVEIDYNPKVVSVRGSQRRFEDIEKVVETEPLDVEGRVQSFTTKVRVLPPSSAGTWQIDPPEVEVAVSIVTETVSRQLTNVTVRALMDGESALTASCDPEVVTISLVGGKEGLDRLSQDMVMAYVNCSGEEPGKYTLPVIVHLPSGMKVQASASPAKVKTVIATRQEPESKE